MDIWDIWLVGTSPKGYMISLVLFLKDIYGQFGTCPRGWIDIKIETNHISFRNKFQTNHISISTSFKLILYPLGTVPN